MKKITKADLYYVVSVLSLLDQLELNHEQRSDLFRILVKYPDLVRIREPRLIDGGYLYEIDCTEKLQKYISKWKE